MLPFPFAIHPFTALAAAASYRYLHFISDTYWYYHDKSSSSPISSAPLMILQSETLRCYPAPHNNVIPYGRPQVHTHSVKPPHLPGPDTSPVTLQPQLSLVGHRNISKRRPALCQIDAATESSSIF